MAQQSHEFRPHYTRQLTVDDRGNKRQPNLNPKTLSACWLDRAIGHQRHSATEGDIYSCPPYYLPEFECPGAHEDTQSGGHIEGGYLTY